MHDRLRTYIDELFASAPATKRTVELKEEILQNLTDKYEDLISEGKTPDAAYNIAIAGIGDIGGLIDDLKRKGGSPDMDQAEMARHRQRSALFVSIAVALYILCVVPCILLSVPLGPVLMFVMIAAATALLIYNAKTKPIYTRMDDTMVEEFKEWQHNQRQGNQLFKAISSAIWAITVALYILVSFYTSAWHITWIIFPIAGAITSVVKAIFDLKR
nr:permease prefix domain 1-containing protein [bacterium]